MIHSPWPEFNLSEYISFLIAEDVFADAPDDLALMIIQAACGNDEALSFALVPLLA